MAIKPIQANIYNNNISKDRIANKRDDEIILDSALDAISKTNNNATAKVQKTLPYLFIASAALISGTSTKGPLSKKLLEAGKTVGTFGVANAISGVFFGAKNKLETRDNSSKKNGILPTVLAFALSVVTLGATLNSASKLFNKLVKGNKTINKTLTKLAHRINNSVISKKLQNAEALLDKHKIITKTDPTTKFLALALTFSASEVILGMKNNKKRNEIFQNNIAKEVLNRQIAQN